MFLLSKWWDQDCLFNTICGGHQGTLAEQCGSLFSLCSDMCLFESTGNGGSATV